MATLKELSERTGYSSATISRILSGDPTLSVTEQTRRIVLEEAGRLAKEAGATVEVTARVTPSDQALTGDYVVTMTANASQVSDTAEFRVAVETSMVWGFVAVVVIAAL